MPAPIALLSSGGKDSLAALAVLSADPGWRPVRLLTTYNETNRRVALHGTDMDLIEAQATSLGLELLAVGLPEGCSNEVYEAQVASALSPLIEAGLGHVAVGDLFLADIRAWRERQFARLGLEAVFPIWGRDTGELAAELTGSGWEAVVCSIDAEQLSPDFLGRNWDRSFLEDLPSGVDPCGENGEFHTFVTDSPLHARRIEVRAGRRKVSHGRFHMLDLRLA